MLALQEDIHLVCQMFGQKTPAPTFFTLGKDFTQLRRHTAWLQALSFAVVRYTLKYQADAWELYFQGVRGRPKYRAKRGDDSFTIPQDVKLRANHLYIPKIGWLVLRGKNPYPEGRPVRATVRRSCGKWYCSITSEVALPAQEDNGLALGLDRNVRQVATSKGAIIPMFDTKNLEVRSRRYQRMMARRVPGSNRREKARYLCAKTQQKLAQERKDWCHQVSRVCADTAAEIVLEDLNTRDMTKFAKGTKEEPGTNVTVKAGLNREILGLGWGQLEQMIGYKAHTLTKVPARYTSQTSHRCGNINKENRVSQAEFRCTACGHSGNADVNAALNILALGTGASGRGGALALVTPKSRQKVGNLHSV